MRQQRKIIGEITKTLPKKSLIHQARKAAKYVLEKNEIEELIKEDMDLETVCERIENKFQEKMKKSLKEKKQSGLWKQMEEPNVEKKYLVRMWRKLNISSKTWRGVMMLQMEGFLVGSRKVATEKKPEEKFYKWCKEWNNCNNPSHCVLLSNYKERTHEFA